jgi:putative transposase
MFRALQVSSSGYYAWLGRKPSRRQQRRAVITDSVKQFHVRSRQIYGYRIHKDVVQETEHRCSDELVRRIMRRNGLRAYPNINNAFIYDADNTPKSVF